MSALSSKKVCVGLAGAALVALALGCGDSRDDTQTTGSGASGSGGSGGSTGGAGGSTTGGSGGSGGSTEDASTPPADGGDVVCGGSACAPIVLGPTSIPACCTAQNTCGITIGFGGQGGMCLDTSVFDAGGARPETGTGVPDPTCNSLMIAGYTLSGCCMPDNTCGFLSPIGGTCLTPDQVRLPGVNLPDGGPMSCVYPPT